jgi:SnoaL-like protein
MKHVTRFVVPVALALAAAAALHAQQTMKKTEAAKRVHPLQQQHPTKDAVQFPVLSKEELYSEDHVEEAHAVETVFSAYVFANDTHNGPLAASLFTEDAIIHFVWNNHGTLVPTFGINPRSTPDGMLGEGCVLTGRADIATYFGYNRTRNLRPEDKNGLAFPWPGHHMAMNKMVKVADDGKTAMLTTAWLTATSQPREGAPATGETAHITGTGNYRIFFKKTGEGWLINEFYGISERPSTTNQCDLKGPLPRPTQ